MDNVKENIDLLPRYSKESYSYFWEMFEGLDISKMIFDENYVEAIVIIHLFIEDQMIYLIMENTELEDKKILPLIKEKELLSLNYKGLARICLFLDYIDESFFNEIIKFNSFRNKIAHRLFKDSFEAPSVESQIYLGKSIILKLNDFILKIQKENELQGRYS